MKRVTHFLSGVLILNLAELGSTKLFLYITFFIVFCSCTNKTPDNKAEIKIDSIKKNFSQIYFDFPDTVAANQVYEGKIGYTSLFDTLKLKLNQDRFVCFYLNSDNKKLTLEELFKTEHDTFFLYKDTLRFKISFKKKGNNFINGYLSDDVYIEKDDSIRNIEKVVKLIIPVYVK